jgi:cytochrome P450
MFKVSNGVLMIFRSPPTSLAVPGSAASIFWRSQTDPIGLFQEAAELGADVVRLPMAGLGSYVAVSGDAAHEMLVLRAEAFTKDTRGQRLIQALLGIGVLTAEGDTWKSRRRVIQPMFTAEHYDRYASIMTRIATDVVGAWGPTVDVRQEMMRLTLAVAGECLFSDGMQGDMERVHEALSAALDAYNVLLAMPLIRPDSWLPFGPSKRYQDSRASLEQVVAELLARRRAKNHEGDDLLGRLLTSGLDDAAITSEVVTMLLAGHETTANALCWGLWELARRPDLQRQVQAEVAGHTQLGVGALKSMPLTRGIWQETLRLHPPVWMLARGVDHDTELAGVPIAAGTTAFVCVHVLHRDPQRWQDAEAFDPHRWDHAPTGTYLPFGAGQRKCLGERFAAMEAAIVYATVGQHVHLSPVAGPAPEASLSVTLRPKTAVRVHARPLNVA